MPRGKNPDGVEVLILRSGVGVRLHRPDSVSQPGAALLWMHGGGYVMGTAKQDDRLCRRFARELGITVAAVDYRLWSPKSNRFGWAAYLGNADPNIAVPARHEDLSGLPPAWIGVGTHDMFHDEDLAYAERLTAAGVPCQVEVVPGAFHGFDAIVPKAGVSQSFFASQCAILRSALAATS